MPRLNEKEIIQLVELTAEQINDLDYESAMLKLEVVVEALEQEGTPYALGTRLYELGTLLSKRCAGILDEGEAKMLKLLGTIESGREEAFDPEKDGRS